MKTQRVAPSFDRQSWLVLAGGFVLLAASLCLTLYRLSLPSDGHSFRDDPGSGIEFNYGGTVLMGVGSLTAEEITRNALFLRPQRPEGWQVGGSVPFRFAAGNTFSYFLAKDRPWAGDYFDSTWGWLSLITACLLGGLGCFVFLKQPRRPETRLIFLVGVFELAGFIVRAPTGGWSEIRLTDYFYPLAFWPTNLFDALASAGNLLLVHLVLVYPVVKRPLRAAPRLTLTVLYGSGVLLLLNSPGLTLGYFVGEAAFSWSLLTMLALMGAGVWAVVHTWRHVHEPTLRAQARWLLWPVTLSSATWMLLALSFLALSAGQALALPGLVSLADGAISLFYGFIGAVLLPLLPLSIAIGIWRDNLFAVDPWLNRALVYGGLTLAVLILYGLIVGGLSLLIGAQNSRLLLVLGTGAAAVAFQPLRQGMQRAVSRLMYGRRDEPEAVLAALMRDLEAQDGVEMLPAFVATLARTLKLPYVALELSAEDGHHEAVAAHGAPTERLLFYRLPQWNAVASRLVIGPRPGQEMLSSSDRRLLAAIAPLAVTTIQAVTLSTELQHSRQQLVSAREEERRRLRRELHDGLGPQLGALTLKLDAARNLLNRDPGQTDRLLAELRAQSQAAIGDVRRLVYGLRPPALDQLGLTAALREAAAELSKSGLSVGIEAPSESLVLPAAVEVAAYRITMEAIHNVSSHAHASRCWVRLALEGDALVVEVVDDGVGLPKQLRAGVGLMSMQERATELGGRCVVEGSSGAGTRVFASLPFPQGGST